MSTTEEEPSVRLCKGDCGRLTRPRNGRRPRTGDEVTITRIDSKYCSPCYNKFSPVAAAARERAAAEREAERDARAEAAVKANDSYLAQRQARLERAQRIQAVQTAERMRVRQARLVRV